MNTVASSKIRSRAHSSEESSLKNSPHLSGPLLLVNIIVFGPSLLYLRSIMSKNIRVCSSQEHPDSPLYPDNTGLTASSQTVFSPITSVCQILHSVLEMFPRHPVPKNQLHHSQYPPAHPLLFLLCDLSHPDIYQSHSVIYRNFS